MHPFSLLQLLLVVFLVVSLELEGGGGGGGKGIWVEASTTAKVSKQSSSSSLPWTRKVGRKLRQWSNLSGLFGSCTSPTLTPYERLTGQPVFGVTTPWGNPYLNPEKILDLDAVIPTESLQERRRRKSSTNTAAPLESVSEEQTEQRMVALYFMDPDDAVAAHAEMKQMENMQSADVRITASSLAKALRHASAVGHGMPTGLPPDPLSGEFVYEEGACLRYKLVPPKRQLYYAARCKGRERVGLMTSSGGSGGSGGSSSDGTTANTKEGALDAQLAVLGNGALAGQNTQRRIAKRDRQSRNIKGMLGGSKDKDKTSATASSSTGLAAAAPHMEGHTGIPVFYCPGLHQRPPVLKRLTTGTARQIPMFFNYEDLERAWQDLQQRRQRGSSSMPSSPPDVEVFNLWDLVTSMDREANQMRLMETQSSSSSSKYTAAAISAARSVQHAVVGPVKRRWHAVTARPEAPVDSLQDIRFIPCSRNAAYKEFISNRGNGKARLRPMR